MVESTLYSRLTTFAGLVALVVKRVYPLIIPQGAAYPAVTYQRISTEPREVAMGGDPGIARARIQVTAWANTFDDAKDVGNQVRLALERWNPTGVFDTYIIAENDLYDEEAYKFGVAIDAQVVHTEATS